jgi:hypothetical protein
MRGIGLGLVSRSHYATSSSNGSASHKLLFIPLEKKEDFAALYSLLSLSSIPLLDER